MRHLLRCKKKYRIFSGNYHKKYNNSALNKKESTITQEFLLFGNIFKGILVTAEEEA